MSKNIVFEGWLTKSPPSKRIWRTKWRRRWFALRQSGELPGQYFLDYYADRNCRRLKGTINLDLCEQVDAGLHMERTGNGTLDPKLRGSVFTIQTQSRIYHLEADCEADMEKWVDAICRVCGLRATDEFSDEIGTCPSNLPMSKVLSETNADSTGPYIPISECITGVRAQDRAFTFDTKNIVTSTTRMMDRASDQIHTSQPQRLTTAEFSENESNLSDEECRSLNSSQCNIRDIDVTKSFTKLTVTPEKNGVSEDGPPVPPRPPKTLAMSKEMIQIHAATRLQEQQDTQDVQPLVRRAARYTSQVGAGPPSPVKPISVNTLRVSPVEDDDAPSHQSLQYWNLSSMPPAVDRALKPRSSTYNAYNACSASNAPNSIQNSHLPPSDEMRPDALQYLDLDLSTPKSDPDNKIRKPQDSKRKIEISHGKSFSAADADSAYKTVDFLKTEAFNITRQDAEASRSNY